VTNVRLWHQAEMCKCSRLPPAPTVWTAQTIMRIHFGRGCCIRFALYLWYLYLKTKRDYNKISSSQASVADTLHPHAPLYFADSAGHAQPGRRTRENYDEKGL
jgi:hypothetical protein